MADFLFEIGCEELPAGYIQGALEALEGLFSKMLEDEGLSCESMETTATPRRLVLFAGGLPDRQAEREVEVPGPPARAAFDGEGNPTRAAEGFARSHGVKVEALTVQATEKGPYVFAVKTLPARETREILANRLVEIIRGIPFPKSMYWEDPSFRFARPLRRILALLDKDVVEFEVNGVESGRLTDGHPFVSPGPYEIAKADLGLLERTLEKAHVLLDRESRRGKILGEVEEALYAHGGKLTEMELLEEVTDLVEWPEVLEGSFRQEYLVLPEEVVAAAMMEHQRYFPVHDASGKMVNRFLTVANRPREYCDRIRQGNERVLAARLYDARFFWDADRRKGLEAFAEGLSGVVYLAGLGTVADKVERMKELVAFAAHEAGVDEESDAAVEAAGLSKADLLTEMVGEFPSLQGVMGRAYAIEEERGAAVAAGIAEHYMPRTVSGALPETATGRLVALADKADTLAGSFVMGLVPSGSQDPYGLRRASVGILRIVIESGLRLNVTRLLEKAWELASKDASSKVRGDFAVLIDFVRDRLYQYYLDRGFRHDILRACLAVGFGDAADFHKRLEEVTVSSKEDYWGDLVTAVERTFNISKGYKGALEVDEGLLSDKEETDLYRAFESQAPRVRKLAGEGDYAGAGRLFVESFAKPLHVFFEAVYVNVEDQKVRSNRLALLKSINLLYSGAIADLAEIVQE